MKIQVIRLGNDFGSVVFKDGDFVRYIHCNDGHLDDYFVEAFIDAGLDLRVEDIELSTEEETDIVENDYEEKVIADIVKGYLPF